MASPLVAFTWKDLLSSPEAPTLWDLIARNRTHTGEPQAVRPRFAIERTLLKHFTYMGWGTQANVFDAGDFVIKCRTHVPYSMRAVEFRLDRMAARKPGLFAPCIPVETDDEDDRVWLEVQQKLTPVDPSDYQDEIRHLYFPKEPLDDEGVLGGDWEWGLDPDGVPHVFDWG